jgi:hypothetical protein
VARRTVVLHASGHSEVRATHAKSLELTGAAEITARATCVAGVRMSTADTVELLRGPVSLTLEVNGHRAHGSGIVNPHHAVEHRVVLRRAATGGPETLVVRSTLTTAGLDPDFVNELRTPGAEVTLTVTEEPVTPSGETRQALVLVKVGGAAPTTGRLAVLWDHADLSVDLRRRIPAGAADTLRELGVVAVTLPEGSAIDAGPHPAVRALIALATAVPQVRVAALNGDTLLEVLLAAGLPPAQVLRLGRVSGAAVRHRPLAPGPVPTVLCVARADAAAVLGSLARTHPRHPVAVESAALDVGTAVDWLTAADAPTALADHPAESPLVVVAPLETGPTGDLRAVARALIEAGLSPRTIADSLAPFGLGRGELYAGLSGQDH